jgi:hypothetical protein
MLHIRGKIPPMSAQVNLDALIKREDLFKEGTETDNTDKPDYEVLRIDSDLRPTSWFFKQLRKPDFQRETSEWKPDRIAGLIKSFINGDIIPSIILWHWKGRNFIIDGGHRLSAIVAWVMNDFGEGAVSKAYFGEENISKDQKRNAEKTRNLIKDPKNGIGLFEEYNLAFTNPEQVSPEQLLKSGVLNNRTIQVQWIKAKSSQDAEKSFFRINGESAPINDTEAIILKSREKPNAIAARAIIHSGNAHKYWGKFIGKIEQIELIATKINKLLFEPELDPKVIHFPIAGKEYSTHSVELVFGIINMINNLEEVNFKRKELLKEDADNIKPSKDENGDATLEYLNKVERIISIISGTEGYSVGLSPLIYFYSFRGRFQITSFFAIVDLIIKWDAERKRNSKSRIFQNFSSIRDKFEDFLLEYKIFITQATINVGSGLKSYKKLSELFEFIIDNLLNSVSSANILAAIKADQRFAFVKVFEAENIYEEERNIPGSKPPKETVIAVAINTFLKARILCPICGGHATFESYNIDHIKTIRDKGTAEFDNLQMGHFYCNSEKENIKALKVALTLKSSSSSL